jgi:ankyrin repeat protein
MKLTKKTNSFIALLLFAATFNNYSMKRSAGQTQLPSGEQVGFTTYSMQQPIGRAQLPTGEWVEIVGLMLNNNAPMQLLLKNFDFQLLPEDVQKHIIQLISLGAAATALEEAAFSINALAQVNKELNKLINEPVFCLQLIKHLAQKFNCTDQKAAETLKTQEAQNRLELQHKLYVICSQYTKEDIRDSIKNLITKGVDLNFTYHTYLDSDDSSDSSSDDDGNAIEETPLMIATRTNDCPLIQVLLHNGADINKANSEGETALMIAVEHQNKNAVQCLLNNPNLAINQQDKNGWTALTRALWLNDIAIIKILLNVNAIVIQLPRRADDSTVSFVLMDAIHKKDYNTAKLMLSALDPEAPVIDTELTPLQIAQQTGNQELIKFVQDAIDKKHKKESL